MPAPSGLIAWCLASGISVIGSQLLSSALYYLRECCLVAGIGLVEVEILNFNSGFATLPHPFPVARKRGVLLFVRLDLVKISRHFFFFLLRPQDARNVE